MGAVESEERRDAAADAAWLALPESLRHGLTRWADLPEHVRAAIVALVSG